MRKGKGKEGVGGKAKGREGNGQEEGKREVNGIWRKGEEGEGKG